MIKALYIFGLDIEEGANRWGDGPVFHAALRYAQRGVGLSPGPLSKNINRLLTLGSTRTLALALVTNEEGLAEIHELSSEKLRLDHDGNPCRGYWSRVLRKELGQREPPYRFEHILDELHELYKIRAKAQRDGATIEEIDHLRAVEILTNAQRFGRPRRLRAS